MIRPNSISRSRYSIRAAAPGTHALGRITDAPRAAYGFPGISGRNSHSIGPARDDFTTLVGIPGNSHPR